MLLTLDDTDEINYYIDQCKIYNLGRNKLREKIKLKEYQRLDEKTKNKLITKEETSITDFVKNPIIIKSNINVEKISEKILQELILENIGPLFGIEVHGPAIILAPLAMAFVTTLLSTLLTIEDDGSYYRSVYRDAKKKRKAEIKNYPGLIIVEIDGLAYDVLIEAVNKGIMPTVKSMMESTHSLRMWETDLSSQTGASQAGILHGNNENITAFRWIEKENNNQMMQCSGVSKVKELESRISDGDGLLVDDGASRSNLFSGDTDNVIFTFSKINAIFL